MSQYTVVTHLRKEGTSILPFPLASLQLPLSKRIDDSMFVLHLLFSCGHEELKDAFVMLNLIYKLLFLEKENEATMQAGTITNIFPF